jgi:hypothetical protein
MPGRVINADPLLKKKKKIKLQQSLSKPPRIEQCLSAAPAIQISGATSSQRSDNWPRKILTNLQNEGKKTERTHLQQVHHHEGSKQQKFLELAAHAVI